MNCPFYDPHTTYKFHAEWFFMIHDFLTLDRRKDGLCNFNSRLLIRYHTFGGRVTLLPVRRLGREKGREQDKTNGG